MKSHTKYLTFNVPARMDFVHITPQVQDAVRERGVQEGLCLNYFPNYHYANKFYR